MPRDYRTETGPAAGNLVSTVSATQTEPTSVAPPPRGSLGRMGFLLIVFSSQILAGWLISRKSPEVVFAIMGWMACLVLLAAFRLKNIGWSAILCLLGLIPVVNLFFAIALASLPPNFARTKKWDPAGRVIAAVAIVAPLSLYFISQLFR